MYVDWLTSQGCWLFVNLECTRISWPSMLFSVLCCPLPALSSPFSLPQLVGARSITERTSCLYDSWRNAWNPLRASFSLGLLVWLRRLEVTDQAPWVELAHGTCEMTGILVEGTRGCVCACMCASMCTYMCMRACVLAHVCLHTYMYTHAVVETRRILWLFGQMSKHSWVWCCRGSKLCW